MARSADSPYSIQQKVSPVGKHHSKHNRSASQYPERLDARGISSAQARMPFFDSKGRKHNTMEAANRASGRGWKKDEE